MRTGRKKGLLFTKERQIWRISVPHPQPVYADLHLPRVCPAGQNINLSLVMRYLLPWSCSPLCSHSRTNRWLLSSSSTLFFRACFSTSCFHMKQLASAQNGKSILYPFVHLPKKASWSSRLIRVSGASFAKQKQSKQMQVLPDCCLREHSYWFGKCSSAFLCDFSFCSLHWEYYRGSCIVPFVALLNFMGNSAGPWVNLAPPV